MQYRLERHDNGDFFWQSIDDPSQQGTLGTTDKQEAERLLNAMNDADLNRWRMLEGQWTVGDLVQLKSGGPSMTIVSGIDAQGWARCAWMRGNKLQKGNFPKDALQVTQPNKPTRPTARKNPSKPRRRRPPA